jgi:hypothetical protein
MLAEYGSGLYKFLLLCHILSALVGIGAVMLNGLYAAQAQQRQGPAGRAVSEANFAVSNIAEKVIYTVPIFGILLVLESGELWEFSETWIWLALLLFIATLGVTHSVLIPGHRRINALLLEMEQGPAPVGGPPPQVEEITALGKKQAAAGAFADIMVVVILVLMIWKPGSGL